MKQKFEIDFLMSYTKEDIIDELKRISKLVGNRPLTKKDIQKCGRVSYGTIHRKFGGLSKAVMTAGLKPNICHKVSDEQLLSALIDLWSQTLNKEGRRPDRCDLKKYNISFSGHWYYRRFGSWKKALIAAYNSLEKEDIGTEINNKKQEDSILKNNILQRGPVSLRKRWFVFKRDEFTCAICGRSGRGVRLELGHKTSVSKGGSDDIGNLQTECFECNRGKRND